MMATLLLHLCKWINPGDTTEIFHHVTHNTIECGVQENLLKDALNVYRDNYADLLC